MNTRHAQIVLTIVRFGSITAAAKALYITQPTLSRTIRALEEELGKKLFVRHSFNISLTDEGLLLRKSFNSFVIAFPV